MVTTVRQKTSGAATTTMWAAVRESYGTPDEVRLRRVEKPAVADDGVLVRVHASSVNRYDWYALQGRPFLARPEFGLLKPNLSQGRPLPYAINPLTTRFAVHPRSS